MSGTHTVFLVQLSNRAVRRLDCRETERMVEYLGGRRTDDGFAFDSAVRRDEAMSVLTRQFGNGYFAAVNRTGC